jgi:hypothetical protein
LKQQPPAAAKPTTPAASAATPTPGAAPGATPQGAPQFCGRCGKPMTFVAQYQRWFCQGCQQYA